MSMKEEKKMDARVRYTQRVVKEAFLDFLKEKPVNKITVKEICEKAQINRATFYSHYADAFDLLSSIEEEAILELEERIREAAREDKDILEAVIQGICNPDNVRALRASSHGDPRFNAGMLEVFNQE